MRAVGCRPDPMRPTGPSTLAEVGRRRPHRRIMARTLVDVRLLALGLRMRVGGHHQVRRRRTAMSTVRSSRTFCLMYRCPFTPSLPTNALDMMCVFMQILILAGLAGLPPQNVFSFCFSCPSFSSTLSDYLFFFSFVVPIPAADHACARSACDCRSFGPRLEHSFCVSTYEHSSALRLLGPPLPLQYVSPQAFTE